MCSYAHVCDGGFKLPLKASSLPPRCSAQVRSSALAPWILSPTSLGSSTTTQGHHVGPGPLRDPSPWEDSPFLQRRKWGLGRRNARHRQWGLTLARLGPKALRQQYGPAQCWAFPRGCHEGREAMLSWSCHVRRLVLMWRELNIWLPHHKDILPLHAMMVGLQPPATGAGGTGLRVDSAWPAPKQRHIKVGPWRESGRWQPDTPVFLEVTLRGLT
jgi:hypothetical protein